MGRRREEIQNIQLNLLQDYLEICLTEKYGSDWIRVVLDKCREKAQEKNTQFNWRNYQDLVKKAEQKGVVMIDKKSMDVSLLNSLLRFDFCKDCCVYSEYGEPEKDETVYCNYIKNIASDKNILTSHISDLNDKFSVEQLQSEALLHIRDWLLFLSRNGWANGTAEQKKYIHKYSSRIKALRNGMHLKWMALTLVVAGFIALSITFFSKVVYERNMVSSSPAQINAVSDSSEIQQTVTPVPTNTTPVPATAIPVPATTTPVPATSTPAPATATPVPATSTPAPATATPVPATATPVPTNATPVPATATPAPATATPVPATATPVPATSTPAPATATPVLATATPVPATTTPVPATATPAPATATPVPATATPAPTTAMPVPATATPIPPIVTPEPKEFCLNSTFSDSFSHNDEEKTYSFILKNDSVIQPEFSFTDAGTSSVCCILSVSDAQRNELELVNVRGNETSKIIPALALPAGQYDLHLYNMRFGQMKYAIQVTAYSIDKSEIEPNNQSADATPLNLGTSVQGVLSSKEDIDVYRLSLQKETITTIEINFDMVNTDKEIFTFVIEKDGKVQWKKRIRGSSGRMSQQIQFMAGEYDLIIKPEEWTSSVYTITIT